MPHKKVKSNTAVDGIIGIDETISLDRVSIATRTYEMTKSTVNHDKEPDGELTSENLKEYVVDKIIDHDEFDGKIYYRVRWYGYSAMMIPPNQKNNSRNISWSGTGNVDIVTPKRNSTFIPSRIAGDVLNDASSIRRDVER